MPVDSDRLIHSAAIAMAANRPDEAAQLARKALHGLLTEPRALLRAATRVHEIGLSQTARTAFRRALQRRPASLDLRYHQAIFGYVTNDLQTALREIDGLLASHDREELHALKGMVLRRLGRADDAALCFQRALRGDPTRVEWWNQVGDLRLEQKRIEDAIRAYNAALQAAGRREDVPRRTLAYSLLRLADCFARSNLIAEAWRFSDAALATDPGNLRARWTDLHLLPIIYETPEQLPLVRTRYEQRLQVLSEQVDLRDQQAASSAVAGMKVPFYLHYQGGNMRDIMARFGALADRCINAWRPDLAATAPRTPLPPAADGRIRVGFCSFLFRRHTITKLFGGWMLDLDPERFSVHVFHLGPERDEVTEAIVAGVDGFHHLPGADAARVCEAMRAVPLDVAIFPELGMATTACQVAAMRVAPVQAVAWGHPVTTGLPEMDLFLSSEAMEPDDGEDHYTEKLVRLPGLSITPKPPIAPSDRDRASFGLDEDDVVYLVPQSLFKLLPTEDALYVRILRQVPRARLVFLHHHSEVVTGLFQRRLAKALAAADLAPEQRLVFVPQLPWADYLALNRCADVFLDGLTWSGGMTTLEALAMGLVPVTLPGGPMRARHTAAILEELGVTETIATDRDAWVRLAVTLGVDTDWRAAIRQRLVRALPALYADRRPIEALQDLLENVSQRLTTGTPP